jgi:hypothetical protein
MEPSEARGVEIGDERGGVRVWQPARGVIAASLRGHVSAAAMPPMIERLDAFGAARRVTHHFFDLWDMEGYDSAVRVDLTQYFVKHRAFIGALHTCTRSRIVRMGVTVANVALGIVTQHEDRAAFEAALVRAVGQVG